MLEARNQTIKFDGYIKTITDDSPSAETGVPVKEAVIVEWWISGYGDGEKVTLGFSTEQAHYYVNAPRYNWNFLLKKKFKLTSVLFQPHLRTILQKD